MAPARPQSDRGHRRSYNLCQAALAIAQDLLLPAEIRLQKFQGEDFKAFADQSKLFSQI
jgi:23S rRNA U2552 (ribose-2'-O)-methylase RlmE/FtsJ